MTDRPRQLRGAVVVVTGASSGIGESTASRFAAVGSTVVLAARRLDRLEEVARRIRSSGGEALPVRCDVTEASDREGLVDSVREAFGRCDVLVNSAGVPGGGPFRDRTPEQIDRVVAVNLLGLMQVTRAFLPTMLEQGAGHVVNVASLAGRFPMPGAEVYGATKHGVIAFSESLHASTHRRGVLVTAVNPAFVKTEGFPERRPRILTLPVERVADAIVRVVREGIAPVYSIPRWVAALEAFRVLTPPLYRMGASLAARRNSD